jgi:hypothetical protein
MLAGTAEDSEFAPEALFEYLDVIEAYRSGDQPPKFD